MREMVALAKNLAACLAGIVALSLVWGAVQSATPEQLNALIDRVDGAVARAMADDREAIPVLRDSAKVLTQLIDGGTLVGPALATVRYYRAQALGFINVLELNAGNPTDASAAITALQDYDAFIESATAAGANPGWIASAEYLAGTIAFNQTKQMSIAYRHWRSCAKKRQAGCMNIMADAKLTGAAGQSVDIGESVEWHELIYSSGTRFTCAGAYSAKSIARIVHFLDYRHADGGEGVWLERANALLDNLESNRAMAEPCDRPFFDIDRYLYERAAGRNGQERLHQIADEAKNPIAKASARYLLKRLTEEEFRAALAGEKRDYLRCNGYFIAFWHAAMANDAPTASYHHQAMSTIGVEACGPELAFARKFGTLR